MFVSSGYQVAIRLRPYAKTVKFHDPGYNYVDHYFYSFSIVLDTVNFKFPDFHCFSNWAA